MIELCCIIMLVLMIYFVVVFDNMILLLKEIRNLLIEEGISFTDRKEERDGDSF